MLNKVLKILLGATIMSSFVTHTIDIDSDNFIIARMTFSDIFGLSSLLVCALILFKDKKELTGWFQSLKYPLIMYLGLFCSVFLSLNIKSTIAELLIVLYLILLSGAFIYAYRNALISILFPILIYTTCIASFIGLYDLLARNVGLPVVFEMATPHTGISGFRYFGQAANYIFTMLTILIPLRYSEYYELLKKRPRKFLTISIVLGMLFLLTTGRISIMVSFVLGVLIFLLMLPRKKGLKLFFSLIGALVVLWGIILIYAPGLKERIEYRIESRLTNREAGTPETDFIFTNFNDAIHAFKDNPQTGSGLGAFIHNYSEFEVHGTYLKMIGETGVVGSVFYIIFLCFLMYMIVKGLVVKNHLGHSFIKYLAPFIIANLISWSYNHHLRKKEFWILYAIIFIVYLNFNNKKVYSKLNEKEAH